MAHSQNADLRSELDAQIYCKLNEARSLLKQLAIEWKEWSSGVSTTSEVNWLDVTRVHKLVVAASANKHWGIRIGIIAHLLRSSLDNATWSIALSHMRDPHRQTRFPITRNRNEWEKVARDCLRSIPANLHGNFKAMQPFETHAQDRNWLLSLQELNNADKHRAISFAVPSFNWRTATQVKVADGWVVDQFVGESNPISQANKRSMSEKLERPPNVLARNSGFQLELRLSATNHLLNNKNVFHVLQSVYTGSVTAVTKLVLPPGSSTSSR